MIVRPPQALSPQAREGGIRDAAFDVLHHELMQERASSLSRTAEKLEAKLAALRDTDQQEGKETAIDRERLLDEAGEALWHLVIQREACGLRNPESFFRELHATPEIRLQIRLRMRPLPKLGTDSSAQEITGTDR
ncbi:hypothetical protein SAMN05216548_101553 [Faunimonas pinastri]|uniref:Uncharacterized protein n=1 Tax=Faunimonas pinastri TaxID=1855383 RepID=A0A1H9AXA5_9HYPH|nr:DUF6665 family protein [Faunimonas pinastri]SEP81390.1 hypothetical protein SAMN05216548_101553 [Faunimonas pinastri]